MAAATGGGLFGFGAASSGAASSGAAATGGGLFGFAPAGGAASSGAASFGFAAAPSAGAASSGAAGFGFGQPAAAGSSSSAATAGAAGFGFGQSAAATAGSSSGAASSGAAGFGFGQTAPASAASSSGAAATAPAGFGFGQSAAAATAPGSGAAAAAPGGLFGQPAAATAPGSGAAAASSTGLFGQPAAATAPGSGTAAAAPGGLFGQPTAATAPGTGAAATAPTGLFGQPAAATAPGTGTAAAAPGGLFGQPAAGATAPGGGAAAAAPAGFGFGQQAPALAGGGGSGASGGAAAVKREFRVEEFEDFHDRFITQLVAGGGAENAELQAQAFAELQDRKATLATLRFRGREDGLDLQNLARGIQMRHPRLAREDLVRLVDEVSKAHRLNQDDCCMLVEQALPLPDNRDEWLRVCAAMYYRECHFLALCLHDMAQNLVQSPPDPRSVVFFAIMQETARSLAPADRQQTSLPFVQAIFDALVLLLSDLTGERAGDQMFLTHAGTMIQLLVETLLAFFFAFKATVDEAEKIVSLLPHVVIATAAPLSQGFTVSDLDLLLREEHADISIKLCLALVCICHPHIGDSKLDLSKVPKGTTPATLRMADLTADDRDLNIFGKSESGKKMKEKMEAGTYWNEESQLGQFLCFAVSGLIMDNEGALRKGYVHWHVMHFFLNEILLSSNLIGDSLTSRLVLRCVHWLLARALLPVGKKWIAVKKLEAQAVNYRFLAPDALQIAVLRTLNRLARVYPPACETFRDIAVNCADTFHLTLPQGGSHFEGSASSIDPWADPRMQPSSFSLGGGPGGPLSFGAPGASMGMQTFAGDAAPWIGAPRSGPGSMVGTSNQIMPVARHDNSALYAEILDFIASLCARGSIQLARFLSQKLHAHNNQWFNWAFILDSLVQLLRDPMQLQQQQMPQHFHALPSDPAPSSGIQRHFSPPIVTAACHLISAMCSGRLLVSHPAPLLDTQSMQTVFYAGTPSVENFAALLTEILSAHPDLMVKAACLGALSHLAFTPAAARQTFTVVTDLLPSMLAGICDIRGSCDGLLAIELLACALRLVHSVPLSKGRYSLNLQPLTHVVIHFIYMKVLAETTLFAQVPRYWRLANLSLRWLRLALRGPLPFSTSPYVNQALIEPYADGEPSLAPEVANRSAMGNAASYVFRALLALDSPIFRRVMYLTLLRGHGVDGLVLGRRSSALRPLMEQTVRVGLDVIRILLQRDVLFCRLHAQQAAQRVEGSGAQLDDSNLLLTHNLLFAEFAFQYPPEYTDAAKTAASAMLNPFAARRVWQSGSAAMPLALAGASGQRLNPSNFNLLLEYVGARHCPQIASSALFIFTQCSLRDPSTVLRGLQLEPWRLQRISADLYHQILSPEEEGATAAMKDVYKGWDASAEARFTFEAAEMDALGDTAFHLDVSSFRTGMSICEAVDVAQQLADDAIVQSADLAVWARGLELLATSSDVAYFRAGYLRGFEVQYDWIGAGAANYAIGVGGTAPPPALAVTSCRLLAIRSLVLLLGEVSVGAATSDVAPTLAQVLLGLEFESIRIGGSVDVDLKRRNQLLPLTAIMELLQNPPPLPSFPDFDAERPSNSGALRAPRSNPNLGQAVKQHATYEAALAILVGLFDIPSLRDIAFRFTYILWGSRYQVLVNILSQPWPAIPASMRRVLMSEATLIMQALSWEMRLVQPWGTPNETEDSSIAGRDRQNMKYKAAETLQKVVRDILSTGEGETDGAPHSTTPFLVATVQKLAETCDVLADASPQLDANVLFSRDPIHDALQASTCACLAPSDSGQMKFCLELRDPHVFLRVWDREQRMLPAAAAAEFTAPVAWQTRSAFAPQDVPPPPDPYDDDCKNALRDLGTSNELVCTCFYANAIFNALGVFMSALLHHLTASTRLSAVARDPRAQDVRAHLEALLPELAESMLAKPSLHRFKTFTGFATKLISAMQRVESPAPLTFAYSLFRLLRAVAVHPQATAPMRVEAHHALLLLLERMLPDIHDDVGDASLAVIGPDDLAELHKLVCTLLFSAFSPVSTTTVASQHDYYTTPLHHSVSNALSAPLRRSPPAPDMNLALLGALLARVPPAQLPAVFPSAELWQQLTGLLNAAHVENPAEQLQLRCSAMCVAALLCRTPPLASALYECGGLEAITRPELLNASQVHFAPAGLPALDMPHPAVLLVILQALTAAVGALPTHLLVVTGVITWLETHHQKLVEVMQWIARLPLATMPEPRQRVMGGAGDNLGGALHSAQIVNAVAAMSAGAIQGGALLLLCSANAQPGNITFELVAETLSGRCWFSSLSSNMAVEERDRVVALCHRCATLFAELWASLCTASHRCGAAPAPHFAGPRHPEAMMARLTPLIDPALSALLALYSSLERPSFSDVDMQDFLSGQHPTALWERNRRLAAIDANGQNVARPGVQAGNAAMDAKSILEQGLYPSEVVQVQVCMHILQAWRYDPVTQQLQVLTDQRSTRLVQPQQPQLAQIFGINPDMMSQLVTRSRARANLLCLMFVHACSDLLSLRLVKRQHVVTGERRSGDSPHLQFEGSREQFRHLLFIVEVTLHLLQSHLSALLLAGLNAAPAPGAPRLALVLQHLRILKQFAAAVGGTVALAARLPQSVVRSSESALPPARMVDLTYVARSAQHVEQQLLELQNL